MQNDEEDNPNELYELMKLAETSFSEWDNDEDEIYDTIETS